MNERLSIEAGRRLAFAVPAILENDVGTNGGRSRTRFGGVDDETIYRAFCGAQMAYTSPQTFSLSYHTNQF
jgi:hypothetical protein